MQLRLIIENKTRNISHVFTGSNIVSINCGENIMDAQMSLTPGICEQYCDCVVKDPTGVLLGYANAEDLCEVTIWADAINLGFYTHALFEAEDSLANVSVRGSDPSSIFDKKSLKMFPTQDYSIDTLLTKFFQTSDLRFAYANELSRRHCTQTIIPSGYILPGTMKEVLKKICTTGMLRIYFVQGVFYVTRCF